MRGTGREWGQVGQVPQAHEREEGLRGHQEMMRIVRHEPALQERAQRAIAAGSADQR